MRIGKISRHGTCPVCQFFCKVFGGCRHDQLFFGAGQSYIEDAEFLAHAVPADLFRDLLAPECRCTDSGDSVKIMDADAPVSVEQHGAGCIKTPESKTFRQTGHKAHRKLQPLALVDAHDPDNIRVFVEGIGLSVVDLLAMQSVNISEELKQSRKVGFGKSVRLALQKPEVGASLGPGGQCRTVILIAGLL